MKNESPLEPLLKQIGGAMTVTKALEESLAGVANIRYYPQGFVLVKAGEVVQSLAVMLKGMAHASSSETGTETSYWFATESHLLTPAVKNGRDIIAPHNVTILEDSFIAFIPYTELNKIIHQEPGFARAVQQLQEKYNNNIALREYLKKQDARQRMRSLTEHFPGLQHKAHIRRMASYLEITPEEYKQLATL